MKLAVVGVGTAGSRIANRVLDRERASGRHLCDGNALLINSKEPSFATTEHVARERRVTIGDVHGEVDGTGTGGDPDLAAEIARAERNEIIRAFDLIEFHQVDGVLVVAGLAGGTGGGAGAVVIDQLQAICDVPVYAVGVLPGEAEGQRPALTAARSLQSFVATADNVIAFDNDAWRADEPSDAEGADATEADDVAEGAGVAAEDFTRVNDALAERLVTLFAAGEFGGASASENLMDPSDIMRTLDTGGVSSIGYASTDVPPTGGVRSWVRAVRDRLPWTPDPETESTDAAKINQLVRRAAQSKLTLPCEVSSADRALIILSGPPRVLSRKGFETGRYWLEGEADVVDVKAGDEPHDGSAALTVVVLFSNVTDVPRIDAMQETAVDRDPPSADWTGFDTAEPR